jgi:4-hydroxybenzoate polyprenyltransferase
MNTRSVSTLSWTIVYDTIYGCQDRKDDMTAGVKSTSILFGDSIRQILIGFAAVFLACMAYAGFLNHQGVINGTSDYVALLLTPNTGTPFFIVSVGGAGLYFTWQFLVWNVNDPQDCGAKFQVRLPDTNGTQSDCFVQGNGNLGYIVWSGMLIDYYLKTRGVN